MVQTSQHITPRPLITLAQLFHACRRSRWLRDGGALVPDQQSVVRLRALRCIA